MIKMKYKYGVLERMSPEGRKTAQEYLTKAEKALNDQINKAMGEFIVNGYTVIKCNEALSDQQCEVVSEEIKKVFGV